MIHKKIFELGELSLENKNKSLSIFFFPIWHDTLP